MRLASSQQSALRVEAEGPVAARGGAEAVENILRRGFVAGRAQAPAAARCHTRAPGKSGDELVGTVYRSGDLSRAPQTGRRHSEGGFLPKAATSGSDRQPGADGFESRWDRGRSAGLRPAAAASVQERLYFPVM